MTTEKKTRTPRNVESIRIGALGLSLQEKVSLRNELTKSIEDQLKQISDDLDMKAHELSKTRELVNGKQH